MLTLKRTLFVAGAVTLAGACSLVNAPEDELPPGAGGSGATGGGSTTGGGTTTGTGTTTGGGTSTGSGGGGATGGSGGCGGALIDCGNGCINPLFDMDHCGASGDCQGPNAGESCTPTIEICSSGECVCNDSYIDCNGSCIDPEVSHAYCGASGDCQGNNAGQQCTPTEQCASSTCTETCINCGFETGDFTGWDTQDMSDPYYALSVVGSGQGNYGFSSAPTEGSFACLNGYDGCGPDDIDIGQDITIGPVSNATLRFDYRAAWYNTGTQDRTFTVSIEPPGGGTPLYSEQVHTGAAGQEVPDSGPLDGSIDVSAYAGQQVYIHFHWHIPECYTGPGNFQLDDVRVTSP